MRWSRAFWLYCAVLSLLFVLMGIGLLRGGRIYNRSYTVDDTKQPRERGYIPLVAGVSLVGYCLFNAAKARPADKRSRK